MKTLLSSLGFLRTGLISLAVISILMPTVEWMVVFLSGELSEDSLLALSAGLIAPVMAPMLIVVILLDVIMAKVRAADEADVAAEHYRRISRLGSILIVIMLAFWVPYFVVLTS